MYRTKRCGLLFFSLILWSTLIGRCNANNNYFIPGDAFFYFEISQDEWKSFKSGSDAVWSYDRPAHLPLMLCGYAGYRNLDVSSLPADYRDRFITAVDVMKKAYPSMVKSEVVDTGFGFKEEKPFEKNKIRVFVYNNEFDFTKHRIGLKYNESWPEMGPRFGHATQHFQFDFFINSPKAISDSWRMASSVNPLNVKLPDSNRGAVETPIRFNPESLKFLIAPPVEIESLGFPSRNADHVCYTVSKSSTQKLVLENRSWKSKEFFPAKR